ncbi:ExbD/TolR family protein [Pajaroellobacter abortibovis]|uniref:Biopolymer transporter n=1 Tax=Pajaroellobacter abortibovis TaxID=1882918 RepID=A0A1L6MVL8_9BACT|nr:biopolymer transporter ExbD [Pajaroellobacter abortibovis]APR99467.1 hypothetical protein BCY86_01305 [Pajaroellobacter abortibovis]
MAGIDVGGGGGGGRRKVDSEINMVPFIDLLMVTISFLLLTAVWSHMARLNAEAQLPGPASSGANQEDKEKKLHFEMSSSNEFTLSWKQGATLISSVTIPRQEEVVIQGNNRLVLYPQLAAKVTSEWQAQGQHQSPTDPKFDQAIIHVTNDTPYTNLIGIMDAISAPKRSLGGSTKDDMVSAFNISFSMN